MKYKIVDSSPLTKFAQGKYRVVEIQTKHVINSFSSLTEAKKFVQHLNRGGSFDGWTPHFFLKN